MRFITYLTEKYLDIIDKFSWGEFNGTPIFLNPDSGDFREMAKSKIKFLRFVADPRSKKFYVFDANGAEHTDAIEFLLRKKELHSKDVIVGYGNLVGGKIEGTDFAQNYKVVAGEYNAAKEMSWIKKYIKTPYDVSAVNSVVFKE